MPDPILTPDRIRAYLIEVAELLPDGSPQCIVVVGGSLLALLGFREATNDVDSIRRMGRLSRMPLRKLQTATASLLVG